MPADPTVVSVPNINKCLSLSETSDITEAVGAFDINDALVSKALESAFIGFQENDFPFLIVAISCCPKLSNDHEAGSIVSVCSRDASPHAVKYSTPEPSA